MTRRAAATAAVAALTAALVAVAAVQAHPMGFADRYYWQSDGVGNFAADAILAVAGAWKLVKEWQAHRDHQRRILEHLDVLHRHHQIGRYIPTGKES